MLKDLAIEIAVSAGLGFCGFFSFLMVGFENYPIWGFAGFLSFAGFILLLYVSARHLKSLLNRVKPKHAIFFIVILVVVLLVSSITLWNFWENMRA
jgi:multisubunit Na+/H+ antiporter MnhB subunit